MINIDRDCRKIVLGNISDEKEIEQGKETFVAALTHDLKTPTIAQIRMLEILLTESLGKLNNEQKEILKQMLKSAKYMLGMILRVLSVYKYENGNTKLEYQRFNFKELVLECAKELLPIAEDKNLKLEIKISIKDTPENNFVSADKIQIRRALINLISNSIFYAYKDTEIKILIKETEENNPKDENKNIGLIFTVTNSSPYIPPDILNTLFDKYVSNPVSINPENFDRGNQKLVPKGTGLGLYITERIISAHGGKIIANSSEDNINTFGFEIPKSPTEDFKTEP